MNCRSETSVLAFLCHIIHIEHHIANKQTTTISTRYQAMKPSVGVAGTNRQAATCANASPIPTARDLFGRAPPGCLYPDLAPIPTKLNNLKTGFESTTLKPSNKSNKAQETQKPAEIANETSSDDDSNENDGESSLPPIDYTLGPNDIICGRGRGALRHPGNLKFQQLVQRVLSSKDQDGQDAHFLCHP